MPNKFALVLLAATALTACTMAPRYERPEAPVAASWANQTGTAIEAAREISWRKVFVAPELQTLITEALANNRDLRIATLNIEAARAMYRIQRADLLPSINATGTGTRQRVPENASLTGSSEITSSYAANIGAAAYELDLFGRVRSLSRRAFNQYMATEEGRNAAQTTLVAEVATAYLTYLADAELLKLTEDTLKTQQESYDVISRSFDMGVGSQLEVSQAATQVETARANLAIYKRQLEQDKNALTLLVGKEIDPKLLAPKSLNSVMVMDELPVGLPSDVLLQRPDIRQAEYVLKGENANIGAARAAFFPSISLTGSAGFASNSLDNLFSSGSGGAWAFTPQITLPIFQTGRLLANLKLANTNRDIAVAQYEKAIQTAFREVADGLVARTTYTEQLQAQQALVAASEKAYVVSQARYKQGLDSNLTQLDAQRSFYAAQQNEIGVRLQRLVNLANLYKALGGGQQ
ncbi:MAG: efflux transporter outer membrane subunit [Blastochloris viridis]|uniref:Efflux transporter outer membrane subunit n=1 Tax=Blastochloris viridis TaxID=1079 RepID=A0A6N4RBG8_BLAVI|nr:MAG: efflux transporter outer membrane subunit [Blastochloris viridis]